MSLAFLLKPLQSRLFSPLVLVFCSGLIMGLAPEPWHLWPLAWVALSPLWVLLFQSLDRPSKTPAWLLGLTWGIGYHGLALSWITGIHPMTWMGVPWLASLTIALLCWSFITLWGAVMVALWAWVMRQISQRWEARTLSLPFVRVLLGTALWCGLEAFWNLGPLVWTSLSYTQSPGNLVILHLGQLAGPQTVTAALVAMNGLLAESWLQGLSQPTDRQSQRWMPYGLSAIALLVSLHGLGWGLYSRPLTSAPADRLRIGIIQGNIPNQIKLYPEGWRRALEGYTTGYEQLADQGVDAVLTPETALPFLWQEWQASGLSAIPTFYQAIRRRQVIAWVGALGQQGESLTNSLFTVTGDGHIQSRYDKARLVPLGEYIPFNEILGQFINRLSPLDAHLAAGRSDQVFDTPLGRAIVGICYESAFSNQFRAQAAQGGQFILSPSNDAHYSAAMPAQHHAQDVMRAIETDRWAVRATNTGYSAIVDPHGHTHWRSQLNTYALHVGTIERRQTQTLYVRWGDWLTPLLLVSSGVAVGLMGRTQAR